MWMICKKEWRQFFSSLTGYLAIIIFLLLNGLLLFVFPDTSILNFGYATLGGFFALAPWVLLFLVPTITMRSFADEYKTGTFEILKTLPLQPSAIVWGKFFGSLLIVLLALIPTIIYAFSIQSLSSAGGLDVGSTAGSYLGLLFLGAAFTSIGIFTSSLTQNTVVAFIIAAFACFFLFTGFDAISKLPVFTNGPDYYIEMLGIQFHYANISKGVIDIRDLLYFFSLCCFFIFLTQKNILRK
ncbi:MAG: gliding motility-associated ABC transporter permease subunit GldF [Bacteroidetes bacterium]|nr:gliding motility-associated ABC transporter permease subunit GldF [Bacteroidota bacterium]